jgi:hypothetical protein
MQKERRVQVAPSSSSVVAQHGWPRLPPGQAQWQEAVPASSVPGLPYSCCEEDDKEGERQQLHIAEEEDPTSSLTVAREAVPALGRQASPALHWRSSTAPTLLCRAARLTSPLAKCI